MGCMRVRGGGGKRREERRQEQGAELDESKGNDKTTRIKKIETRSKTNVEGNNGKTSLSTLGKMV